MLYTSTYTHTQLPCTKEQPNTMKCAAGGRPLLQGKSDIDQLGCIASLFGGISPAAWPAVTQLPDYAKRAAALAVLYGSCSYAQPEASQSPVDLTFVECCQRAV